MTRLILLFIFLCLWFSYDLSVLSSEEFICELIGFCQFSNGLANMVMIIKNIGVFWIVFRVNML